MPEFFLCSTDCESCGVDIPSSSAFWSRDRQHTFCCVKCLGDYEKKYPDPAFAAEEADITTPVIIEKRRFSLLYNFLDFFHNDHSTGPRK